MNTPLAELMRPKTIGEYIGQEHLLGKGKPIRAMIERCKVASMILWGPPGCGKTTLAHLIAASVEANFVPFSAVTSGVAEVRKIIDQAEQNNSLFQKPTILFVDEIHRFNKSQQDAFLPGVESGIITLIGATTENPGFRVNAPLISRAQVYILQPHSEKELNKIFERARGFFPHHVWEKPARDFLVHSTDGDARTLINSVELAASLSKKITLNIAQTALQKKAIFYDKKGDYHYDTISAFIKSMRGNQPDATLHYLARMIKAGEDPLFIARRMVIFASEDVGNVQPTALVVATSCMQAVQMIGMPEAQIILAQCATFLATAKKSTASYAGLMEALQDIDELNLGTIPLHLRNASNQVMKNAGYGKDHIRYPWQVERETGKTIDQEYMPTNLKGKKYYRL